MANEVANTILQQLGGGKFIAMTGSSNFLGSADALTMKLARNTSGGTHMRITLAPSDTYTIEVLKFRKHVCSTVRTLDNVYFDQLQPIFTDLTGLHTRLF